MTPELRPVLPETWPPLITSARQPRWMPWRDRVLTIAMWLLLAVLCRNSLLLGADLVREALGGERRRPAPDFLLFWERLEPYVIVTVLLLMWIVTFGTLALRRLRRPIRDRAPVLLLEDEAARQATTPEAVLGWREPQITVLHVNEAGHMRAVPAVPAASPGTG